MVYVSEQSNSAVVPNSLLFSNSMHRSNLLRISTTKYDEAGSVNDPIFVESDVESYESWTSPVIGFS